MFKTFAKMLTCVALIIFLGTSLQISFAQSGATPLAPGSIQVSRVQYDGNGGNNYVSPYNFPEIFNDQAGCNVENDICNIAGIQGSIYIDQYSTVPQTAVAGSLSLPSTGAPVTTYPTPEPGTYITTSFSSKSEGALMLSPNGQFLTYMGYQGGDQLDDVSNSYSLEPTMDLVPNTYTDSNGNPYPFYDREVALIGANGLLSLTPIDNADSGDNPRAAITVDGGELYTAGNSDSTEYTNHGVVTGPGLSIGVRCAIPEISQSYQLGTYVAADRTDESAKKHIKDNNWRGVGIYTDANGNPQLYVSKGSGSNGDDGVFQVGSSLPACTNGGTDNNATITELFGAPATNPNNSNIVSQYTPFGFWFANPTTLYVADEGYQNTDVNGNLIPDPYAGLEKWSLVSGTWTLDYTIQAGLNLYQAQNPPGYVDQNGNQIQTFPTGIRNMTGAVNGDGTVTIYAITAQYSSVSSGEPDPDSLVGITDSLAATTLPANEQFVTLQTSGYQEVFRGVAYIPTTAQRATQTITFASVGTVTYGQAPIALSATATSGWPIVYSVISGPATVSGNILTITGAGSVTVEADQSGNTAYSAAPPNQQTFTVNPEATSVTWVTPAPIVYGTLLSGAQLDATGSVAGTLVYNPPAGTLLTAGVQTLSVIFTPSDSNYAPSNGSVQLQVNQATPVVTWATPAPITYGTSLSGTQLNATANVAGSFAYNPTAGTVLNAGLQTLNTSFTPYDTVDYTSAAGSVQLQVNQASTTVVWSNPAAITYGTPLSATQLDASATPVSGGTYVYTPAAGTVLNAGLQSLAVTFTPSNTNYAASSGSASLQVNQATQSISFTQTAPPTAVYNSNFTVAATATSGLPVAFTSSGVCTNSGATYTMTAGAGSCTVKASQSGNSNYLAASNVNELVSAQPATQIVSFTGAPATAPYDSNFNVVATSNSGITPILTASSACLIAGTTVTIESGSGTCTLTAVWNGNGNYKIANAVQMTTAEKANPIITWPTPAPITYGTALSTTQLNATANTGGTFLYSPRVGTIENAGDETLSVTFTPTSRADYNTATATVPLTVNQVGTSTAITSNTPNPSKPGQRVTVHYAVTAASGDGKFTGSVTVSASTGESCSGNVTAKGTGDCAILFESAGARTITATYTGDGNNLGSASAPVDQTVN